MSRDFFIKGGSLGFIGDGIKGAISGDPGF